MKANPDLKNSIEDVESDTRPDPEIPDFFKLVFENSPNAKTISKIDKILIVNRAFCDMLGYTKNELEELKWFQITHPEDIEESQCNMAKLLNRELDATKFEKRYLHKNGTTIWVEINTYLLRDLTGNPLYFITDIFNITERKQTEAALNESELKYRGLVENLPDAIAIYAQGKVVWVNKQSLQLLAANSEDELIGKPVLSFVHPDYKEIVIERMNELANNPTILKNTDEKFIRLDGSEVFVEVKAMAIRYEGKPAVQLIVRDNTERIKAKEALLKSEELMSLFMKHSPIYAFIKEVNSKESRVLKASENFIEMLGVKGSDMVGKTMEELFPPEFAKAISLDDWKVVSDGHVLKLEEKLNDRDYITYKYPIIQIDGNLLAGYTIDITELKQSERALRKTKQQYDNLVAKIPVGVYILKSQADETYALKYVSPRMAEMLGLTVENLKSEADSIFGAIHPDDVDYVYKLNQEGIHLQRPFDWKGRFIVKGKIRWMHISSLPQLTESGDTIWHGLIEDITESMEAEAEIRHQNEELISLNATKDKFFSIIAHDLRSPFSSFLGLTQIMAEELPSLTMAQVQEIAVSMSKSATNLYRLIENLLQWARIQQGKIPYNPANINLLSLVNESTEMMLETAKSKEIKLIFSIPGQLEVLADKNTFQTIIRNLVSNAIKFTHKGGSVIISAKETNDKTVEISINDTGIGMSQGIIEKLFQLGVQSSRVGTEGEPSTGLGLILCKEFVEKHGGKIWAKSEVGKGSTFYITINLAK